MAKQQDPADYQASCEKYPGPNRQQMTMAMIQPAAPPAAGKQIRAQVLQGQSQKKADSVCIQMAVIGLE
jgi:hypothetical protein